MAEADVVIAGAGPTGMMLAGELALAGLRVVVVERRQTQALAGSRAGGLHARSMEVLDQRGIVGPFLAAGQRMPQAGFAMTPLSLGDLPTRFNFTLALWQNEIERLLAEWIAGLPVTLRRGCDVTGFEQDAAGVTVALSDGGSLRAGYLVGCDGGRSVVRKAAGIGFEGWEATTSTLLAEVEMTGTPPMGLHRNPFGVHSFGRVNFDIRDGVTHWADHGPWRVMVTERASGAVAEPTLADLRAALIDACGSDHGIHSPIWVGRFTDQARQAVAYRAGRVLLAGDAAHIHSPHGGQGLNTGLQDAVNLGWKLGLVARGLAPDALLDSYHAERHPVAARVLHNTMAQVALGRSDDRSTALRDMVAEMLRHDGPRRQVAGMLTGLDIAYDLGPGHPLIGRRMPDLELADGQRVFGLLHGARGVLLNLGGGPVDLAGWTDRVTLVAARYDGPWDLPVLGNVAPVEAVLIRPDGHVAWAGGPGLTEALGRWFGPPSPTAPE